jgi:GT2 family glycosyltransferase
MVSDVDAVVVTYESASHLARCIASARAGGVTRIVVVDNDSRDSSVEVARDLADDVIALPQNVGFATAQNIGVARCRAPYVLLLNPDAELAPGAVRSGIYVLERCNQVGAVEGAIVRADNGAEERWQGPEPGLGALAARLLRLRERLGEDKLQSLAKFTGQRHYADRGVAAQRSVPFLAAVALLVRRAAFFDVSGFDEAYFLYAEDVDLCRRLRARGWKCIALPRSWARHEGGASSAATPHRRAVLWWTSHRRLVATHWFGIRRAIGIAVCGLGLREAQSRAARDG